MGDDGGSVGSPGMTHSPSYFNTSKRARHKIINPTNRRRTRTGVHRVVHGNEDEARVAEGGGVPAEEQHRDVVVPKNWI